MHPHPVLASVLIATNVSAAEPIIFYTAHFPDATVISLSLVGDSVSGDDDYDFDVLIGLTTTGPDGRLIYADPSKHPARVRCAAPAKIMVGAVEYSIGGTALGSPPEDWKQELWLTVCKAPVS